MKMAIYEVTIRKKEKGKMKFHKIYVNSPASSDAEKEAKTKIKRNEKIVDISRSSDFNNQFYAATSE